jgi:hypothetical protein
MVNISFSQIQDGQFYVPTYPVPDLYYSENAPELPEMVLNHKLPYFPQKFYDQGHVPSCGQASAIYYCLTYEYNRLKNTTADSSSTFAPLYTYFFLDYGDNWYGASSFDSWNIVKNQGNPILNDLPEYIVDDPDSDFDRLPIWMNGYDKYYRSMKNRISGCYSIDVSNEEGLKILQHYLNDHLRQEATGGTAILYGTPNAIACGTDSVLNGWFVMASNSLSNDYSHSMTIVGYYINTIFDFNDDGIITDSIDINDDNIIDFHDNEKLLWIIANSADNISSPVTTTSIFVFKYDLLSYCFNGQVFLPVPDTAYQPELTAKVRFTHPLRGFIKIRAGISSDINSDIPEHIIDLPIFNFLGGQLPMQGDDTIPNPETIEIGLDISPLLQYLEVDKTAKVFLIIDNASILDGSLDYFSVIRYDSENPIEYAATLEDNLLPEKSSTRFSVNLPLISHFDEDILRIESDSLYTLSEENNYSAIISATGGTPPYSFYKYREDEYRQELSSQPYEINPYDSTLLITDSLLVPDQSVIFAGEAFDTVIFSKKGSILFRTEEPSYFKIYPYQYYPMIPFFDLEIRNYYPFANSFTRRFGYNDSCLIFYHYGSAKVKTIINNNGIIQLGYTSSSSDWTHSSYLNTRCHTYYSNLLPYSYLSEYKSTIFYPVPDTSGITIETNGTLSLDGSLMSGTYKTYVLAVDSEGKKAVKLINLEISGINDEIVDKPSLILAYPNPAKDEIFIEFENYKTEDVLIEITNSLGKIVFSEKFESIAGNNIYMIPLHQNGILSGHYTGNFKYGNGIERFRFVVIR